LNNRPDDFICFVSFSSRLDEELTSKSAFISNAMTTKFLIVNIRKWLMAKGNAISIGVSINKKNSANRIRQLFNSRLIFIVSTMSVTFLI
jgi:hypothetical protein